jgi:hypothetical protein
MTARASACLVMGLLLSGCPFALDDDYFIDEGAAGAAAVPVVADPVPPAVPPPPAPPPPAPPPSTDAAPPEDAAGPNDCTRKGPCLPGYECRGKECEKIQ